MDNPNDLHSWSKQYREEALRECCFYGRDGELEDREPVLDALERWLLRCPERGHLDDLGWLTQEAALMIWDEAPTGRPARGRMGRGQIRKPS
jgi:hypothetical protein